MVNDKGAPDSLGERIRKARLMLGLSELRLAGIAGVHVSNISRIESGETSQPSVRTLKHIADALHVDVAQLLAYQGVTFNRHSRAADAQTYYRSLDLPDAAIAEVEEEIERIIRKYRQQDGPSPSE